ncbi:hypothetical protein [Streptomyces chartreusis]|uniref:Uncharacterized protein n=1 Tax=Streptomyces chartreusis TaxID=1969 RepID=A0A7H8TL94_STRCX|nr:hypothetical protein [Streptomyces chartreusis]QKZ15980.1 hypothetical protein HUT05_00290 [Streptomyces chartreusis]QKZ23838.1 hypothetical protein HUT05_44675 [Streptomyces chartreusis]
MNRKTITAAGRGAVHAYQHPRSAVPVPVRLLEVGRLWRHERLLHDVDDWMPTGDSRCEEDPDQRFSVGYLAVTVGSASAAVPERATADLAALDLPTLPADESQAMSTLAHFDRALPPHMALKVVTSRHLTAQWPAPGTEPAPQSAGQGGQLTAQALADLLADPTSPIVTEALRLLSVTARQTLTQASQAADRQVCEGRVARRVRALLASRTAPGGRVLCAYFTTVIDDRVTWGPDFTVAPADEDPPDLRYPQTTATPIPAGHTEPEGDLALVEALNELAAIEEPAEGEVLRVHVGNGTVTRVTG